MQLNTMSLDIGYPKRGLLTGLKCNFANQTSGVTGVTVRDPGEKHLGFISATPRGTARTVPS